MLCTNMTTLTHREMLRKTQTCKKGKATQLIRDSHFQRNEIGSEPITHIPDNVSINWATKAAGQITRHTKQKHLNLLNRWAQKPNLTKSSSQCTIHPPYTSHLSPGWGCLIMWPSDNTPLCVSVSASYSNHTYTCMHNHVSMVCLQQLLKYMQVILVAMN